ncbi:arginase family protein [Phialemonium atrogriseum]|uniref:Arginase family protein n=1 Tax=Phialemonium atrogriseum TaxID=1093897 RepID=A0AAJ0BYY7_9PEZI|nr:arginase family protein [Phialemonium atrogriseum]KAK1767049.1 arginase family protein [Phialemonium atrogriseum]
MRGASFTLVVIGGVAAAWEFPRLALSPGNVQHPFSLDDDDGDVDIVTGSQFSGLKTFANLPYVNCFSDEEAENKKYDIAILGAPFDTSVTARPGARYGPTGIRTGSQRIYPDGAWSVYTGENVLNSWATIVDCGDAPLTWLDNNVAFRQLDKPHKVISGRKASNYSVSATPRILTLGGDHTTTLSALRSTHERWDPVSVIHFDSHIDTWDPAVLGGGISDYAGVNHGTFLHIAHEEGLIRNTSIHVGIRAPLIRRKGDLRNDRRCGFDIITARDLDLLGGPGAVVSRIRDRVGSGSGHPVYISVDIDVLDPAFAPATGTAEPGGWTTRELLTVLDGLRGLPVVGADVVEVAPVYDNPGEITVLAAAEVALSLIALMVGTPVPSGPGPE